MRNQAYICNTTNIASMAIQVDGNVDLSLTVDAINELLEVID